MCTCCGVRDLSGAGGKIGRESSLEEKEANFSEMSVPVYQSTVRHMPVDGLLGE